MSIEDLDITKDKHIDKYALDEECAKQPGLYQQYSEALADAEYEYDKCKNELAITEAEVAHEIRVKGETPAGVKVTEKSVSEAVLLDKKVKGCTRRLSTAQHDVKVLRAAVGAIDHKKSMLGNLVKMFLASYYGEGSLPITGDRANSVNNELMDQLNDMED